MTTKTEIDQAVSILNNGGLVAFPTETVYGLGADAQNPSALEKVFTVKNRPFTNPLIVHIVNLEAMVDWAFNIPADAIALAKAFWPGPLTLILKKKPHVDNILTGGQETVALRVPAHPVATQLLTQFGRGVAAPSANKFTRISPTTADAVRAELGNDIDSILDGGNCEVGLESTIVDVSQEKVQILRPGMITIKEIEHVLNRQVVINGSTPLRVPGRHHLHYAPKTQTNLIESAMLQSVLDNVQSASIALVYSEVRIENPNLQVHRMPRDARAYAKILYETLRASDQKNYAAIYVENVPVTSEWTAIHDRLKKASARSR